MPAGPRPRLAEIPVSGIVAATASVDVDDAILRVVAFVRKRVARRPHYAVRQSAHAARCTKRQVGEQFALFDVTLRIDSVVAADAKIAQTILLRLPARW